MRFLVVMVLWWCGCFAFAVDEIPQQIEEPTQSSGTISSPPPANQAQDSQGQKIYERFCIVCHRDGLVGAPKFRDEQQWKSHLSGKTMDELVAVAVKGLNAMPAKGTCYECSEQELKSAIEYMLPK
jgi:cytochrome c5